MLMPGTALMMARSNEVAKMLLEAGGDIRHEDKQGNTTLTFAGQSGLWEAGSLMLKLQFHHDKHYKKFIAFAIH